LIQNTAQQSTPYKAAKIKGFSISLFLTLSQQMYSGKIPAGRRQENYILLELVSEVNFRIEFDDRSFGSFLDSQFS
jgi:hypothetical protein